MKNITKFLLILCTSGIALIMQFAFNKPFIAQLIISVVGIFFAILMFAEMIKTLKSGKYGVDLLAITAIIATLLVGEYWAAMIILIMLVGGDSLEDFAVGKADKELKSLLDNTPTSAHRIKDNKIEDIDINKVKIGDNLLIKPGEVIPVDGYVINGIGMLNEASLTGESKLVKKLINDEVMSGSVNEDTIIKIKVKRLAKDSQYQQLVKLVKQAESEPSNFVRMADRYAIPFTFIAYLIAGIAWFISKNPIRFAEVLVVASPCPLILAAPVAMVAGMSKASKSGIIIKSGNVLEKMATAKTIFFDKTGTITQGILKVNKICSLNHQYSEFDILTFAFSAEQNSNHILARSIINYAKKNKVNIIKLKQLKEFVGKGIQGIYNDKLIRVGNYKFAGELPYDYKLPTETCIYISVNKVIIGYILFKDIVRPEAKKTVKLLRQLKINNLEILTGDKKNTAKNIAGEVEITKIKAELLPSEKIDAIKAVSKNQRPVIMVGDGVNDAPSLAIADVGIAMGAHGATAASESADVVILKDNLTKVPYAIALARNTMKVSKQSVWIGMTICTILMFIACTGVLSSIIGALCQEIVDTVSILWSLKAR